MIVIAMSMSIVKKLIAMSMSIVKKLSSIKIKLGMWMGPAWLGVASPPPGQGGSISH